MRHHAKRLPRLWVKFPHKKFAASLLKKASLLHTHTHALNTSLFKMSKLSSKKTQEGVNNRLQVVMRSGKYTVRTKAIGFDAISLSLSLLGSKTKRFEILCGGPSSRGLLSSDDDRVLSRGRALSLSLSRFFFLLSQSKAFSSFVFFFFSLIKNSLGTKRSSKPFAPGKPNSFSSRTTFRRCVNPRLNTTPCWRKPACTITPGTTWTWGRRAVGFTECRA